MEELLPQNHYTCKPITGLCKYCKPMAGLIKHTVNFFQDETHFHRSTKPPLLQNGC
jgi:hypothetical protein